MAEYIDRQKLIDDFHTAGSCFVYGDYIPAIVSRIKMQPTIEPEALPIVRELREKLMLTEANQQHFKEERDEFEFKMREVAEAANAEIDRRNKTISELREELKQAKAERDAAVKELEEVTKSVDDLAEFVDSEIHPSVDYGLYLALRENVDAVAMFQHESEWRGPAEESEDKANDQP